MIAIVISSFLLLWILSYVYFHFGSLPTFDKVFNGIMPAVLAIIIAVVGCFQGFQVQGSGESVGRQTTISVVQIIFILILILRIFT